MPSAEKRDSDLAVATIRASALAPLAGFIADCSLDPDVFLGNCQISPVMLSDPYAQISLAQYVGAFEQAAVTLKDPSLGLAVGVRISPADLGPMGVLFSISSTMQAAFERLSRHVLAFQGGTQSSAFEVGSDLVWTYRLSDIAIWPRRQDAEYTLAAVCKLARSRFGTDWTPQEIHFEHGNRFRAAILQRVFRAPVLFNQSANRVIFDKADAVKRNRREDTGLVRILERHIADLLGQRTGAPSLIDQVRGIVNLSMGQRPVTLTSVAAQLNMSHRSLQRRLSEQGSSLRDILRDHRKELAILQLREAGMSVSEIASNLGYADATVFWRAFRAWTGECPSAVLRSGSEPPPT